MTHVTIEREALQTVLEALEGIHPGNMTPMAEEYWNKAITVAKQALERPAVPLTDEEAHNVGERAEELLGHGHGAWDIRPLHEIVCAVLTAAEEMNGITASPKKGQP